MVTADEWQDRARKLQESLNAIPGVSARVTVTAIDVADAACEIEITEHVGALFMAWAVPERMFTKYSDDYRVAVDLCNAFAAGFEAGRGTVSR